jgi:hypothetical protein
MGEPAWYTTSANGKQLRLDFGSPNPGSPKSSAKTVLLAQHMIAIVQQNTSFKEEN